MKYVLLSHDHDPSVYSVPDEVANNLRKYCIEFCVNWLEESPHAQKYHSENGSISYNEEDFIEYLNEWIFPNEKSVYIETIDFMQTEKDKPEKYKDCAWFNF